MAVTVWQGLESFTNAMWAWVGGGKFLVDQHIADERAATCVSCHNNVNVDQAVKMGCCGNGMNSVLNSFAKRIIQNRTTPSDTHLKSCALCGCYLKIKVWMPEEALGLTKEDANAYPSFCWIKKELDPQSNEQS